MPRIEHEPWCHIHDGDDDGGRCSSEVFDFGPTISVPGWSSTTMGGVAASRLGRGPLEVYIDYRTQGGMMDAVALRSVREAVAASPEEFLSNLDRLIEQLGPYVPPAQPLREEAAAS